MASFPVGCTDLPPDWEAKSLPDGRVVYINHVTKTTQWNKPQVVAAKPDQASDKVTSDFFSSTPFSNAGSARQDSSRADDEEEELPSGWSAITTPTGEVYYLNHANKSTTWDKPRSDPSQTGAPPTAGAAAVGAGADRRRSGSNMSAGSNSSRLREGSAGAAAVDGKPLPAGWSAKTTPSGSVYYENHHTRSTTWERPKAPATLISAPAGGDFSSGGASVNSASGGDGVGGGTAPLPSGWSAKTTASGATYYENHVSKSTTWERPTIPVTVAVPSPVPSPAHSSRGGAEAGLSSGGGGGRDESLPPEWSAKTSSTGETYYSNHVTKRTSWERPTGPVVLQAVAPPVTYGSASSDARRASFGSNGSDGAGGGDGVAAGAGGEAPLPRGWSTVTTPTGETYYLNHVDKTTSWDRPAPAVSFQADAPLPVATAVEEATTVSLSPAYGGGGGGGGGGGEAPLPAGWSAKVSPSGSTYYENHNTKSTSWERPTVPVAVPETSSPPSSRGVPLAISSGGGGVGGQEAPLPPGWSAKTTSSGKTYYENHDTKSTSWERPLAPTALTSGPSHGRASSGAASPYSSVGGSSVGGAEEPLPPGWSAKTTSSGAMYYENHITKSTTWKRPAAPATPAAAPSHDHSTTSWGSANASGGGGGGGGVGGQEGPLPPGWSAKTTSSGKMYYENHDTKSTTWERPTVPAGHVSGPSYGRASSGGASPFSSVGGSSVGGEEAPLPPGWSAKTTSSGAMYYENHITKSTTWKRPAAPATPAAAPSHDHSSSSWGSANASGGGGGGGVGGQEAPLPPGWSAKQTASGRTYYENHNTKATSWERPTAPVSLISGSSNGLSSSGGVSVNSSVGGSSSSVGGGEAPLPPGWRSKTTASGKVYYENHYAKSTSWERPAPVTAAGGGSEAAGSRGVGSQPAAAENDTSASPPADEGSALLPPGWYAKSLKTGQVCYVNDVTKTTQWNKPSASDIPRISTAPAPGSSSGSKGSEEGVRGLPLPTRRQSAPPPAAAATSGGVGKSGSSSGSKGSEEGVRGPPLPTRRQSAPPPAAAAAGTSGGVGESEYHPPRAAAAGSAAAAATATVAPPSYEMHAASRAQQPQPQPQQAPNPVTVGHVHQPPPYSASTAPLGVPPAAFLVASAMNNTGGGGGGGDVLRNVTRSLEAGEKITELGSDDDRDERFGADPININVVQQACGGDDEEEPQEEEKEKENCGDE
ncbi:unnamed protein product [Pylaiella littoralis]